MKLKCNNKIILIICIFAFIEEYKFIRTLKTKFFNLIY